MYKFARDTWLVFARQMGLLLRNPVWVFVGIMQPLFFLLLFGPLLKGIPGLGGNDAYKIFIPGLLIQLAIFGTLFVGLILVVLAIPFGLRVPVGPLLLTLALLALIAVLCSSLSYGIALWLKSEDALAPLLNMVSLPVLLLAGILLPMTLGPRWLQRIASLNPFSHIVDAARVAFSDRLGDSSLIIGLVCAAALAVAGLAVATRTFQRESA